MEIYCKAIVYINHVKDLFHKINSANYIYSLVIFLPNNNMKLIHFGCSFAVGNGVPHFIKDLPGDMAPSVHRLMGDEKRDIEKQFNFKIKQFCEKD